MKGKLIYLAKILSILLLILIIFFTIKPLEKNVKIEDSSNGYINLKEGETILRKVKFKNKETIAIMFYNNKNISDIELIVTVKYKDKQIYQNTFYELNKTQNIIYFDKKLTNVENLDVEFELVKAPKTLKLSKNSNDMLQINQITTQKTYEIIPWLFITYGICTFIILKNKLKCKKIDLTKVKKTFTYTFYLIISLLTAIVSMYLIYSANYKFYLNILHIIGLLILLNIVILTSIVLIKNKNKLEELFLIIAIPIASFYCIFSLPGDIPDEYKHFARAYDTTKGKIIIDKYSEIPSQVISSKDGLQNVKKLFNKFLEKTDYNNTKIIYNAASTYNPILYIFASLSIFIVEKIGVNIYIGWYIGKILNLIFYLIMGYFTIKKMPSFKMLTFLYLLMPMNVYLCTSISCDALINTCVLYLIAHILNIKSENKKVTYLDYLVIIILGFIGIVTKPIYFPIILAVIIISRKQLFSNINNKIRTISSIISILLLYYIWNKLNSHSNFNLPETIGVGDLGLKYAIFHPFSTLKVLFNFLIYWPDTYILDFIGYKFIWSSAKVPTGYATIYLILMLLVSIIRDDKDDFKLKDKITFIMCSLIASAGVIVAMYFIEYRSNMLLYELWGIQGRYFIPIFILFFMCISKIKGVKNHSKIYSIILTSTIGIHILYILKLMEFLIL